MAVYVDNYRARFGRMVMCHMLADTEGELHVMADRIGLRREWYQRDASTPHYDVSLSRRAEAVRLGAREVGRTELVAIIRAKRAAGGT